MPWRFTHFWHIYVAKAIYALLAVFCRENDLRAPSGKFLRVKFCRWQKRELAWRTGLTLKYQALSPIRVPSGANKFIFPNPVPKGCTETLQLASSPQLIYGMIYPIHTIHSTDIYSPKLLAVCVFVCGGSCYPKSKSVIIDPK